MVNVSSLGGRVPIANEAAYCASKFALCGWTEAMAVDLHGTGVEVKLVLPGPIDTEIWDQPGNDPAAYQGPFVPAAEAARVDRRGHRGRPLRVTTHRRTSRVVAPNTTIVVGKSNDPGAFVASDGHDGT